MPINLRLMVCTYVLCVNVIVQAFSCLCLDCYLPLSLPSSLPPSLSPSLPSSLLPSLLSIVLMCTLQCALLLYISLPLSPSLPPLPLLHFPPSPSQAESTTAALEGAQLIQDIIQLTNKFSAGTSFKYLIVHNYYL